VGANNMSYLDYRKLPKKIYYTAIVVVVLCSVFLAGAHTGRIIQQEQDRLYVGRVIEKEHVSEKIENGERFDEAYYIVVEDNHGEYLRYSVSKDEYKQVEIKDLWRR
jgi:hypothetical protein